MHKKQLISEKLEFEDEREEKEREILQIIIDKVVIKAEFLCVLQLPRVAIKLSPVNTADSEQGNTMMRKASLMRQESSVAEEVFDLKKRVLPQADRKKLIEDSSTTSVLACL